MKNGPYILIIAPQKFPGKKYRNRYCYEHQAVWWQNTGEIVTKPFLIHHKNENKHDNNFSNLEKKLIATHSREHNLERAPKPIQLNCKYCNKEIFIKPRNYRSRLKINKNGFFCSQSCGAKFQHSKVPD